MNRFREIIEELFFYLMEKRVSNLKNRCCRFINLRILLANRNTITILVIVASVYPTLPSISKDKGDFPNVSIQRTNGALGYIVSQLAVGLPTVTPVPVPSPSIIALQAVVTGLDLPLAIVSAGDGTGRLFIVQQGGKILVFDGTQALPTPFLDITSLVSCCGERGLLGLAFHPDYSDNGFFYVDYTDVNGDTVVARYTVSGSPNAADPNSALTVLTVDQPFVNHNGGNLGFGPDDYLYVSMGDGGGTGDPQNNAQRLDTVLGKILRIDVDRDDFTNDPNRNYAIPIDNPFVGDPDARGEIWVLGLRNPWRFSFDRQTEDLFIGDVGQGNVEEIDFQSASSSGGENYGWRCFEGNATFNNQGCSSKFDYDFPILQYTHSLGCSVTGGFRYRGTDVAELAGRYLYGDFCGGRIWGAIPGANGTWVTTQLLDTALLISSFGEDESGELYVADLNGSVYKIVKKVITPTCACGGQVKNCSSPGVICGSGEDDVINGTPKNDFVCGFGGNDTITGLNGNDCINGGGGNDVLIGNLGADILIGGTGNDDLRGGKGFDNLKGDSGNDTLRGWNGNDILDGGLGVDQLIGGSGIDTCRSGENKQGCER